jgi:serine/threonine-protein kinase
VDADVDHSLVDEMVERILGTDGFRRSERLAALLRYLVRRRRTDPGVAVKEYEIGLDVFGRPVTYDPRTEPVVRVTMRELRNRLATYFAGAGAAEPFRIEVPKGTYRVVLRAAEAHRPAPNPEMPGVPATRPAATGRPLGWLVSVTAATVVGLALLAARSDAPGRPPAHAAPPSVAVLPFVNLTGDASRDSYCDGLTEELIVALMRLNGLLVTGRTSAFAFKGSTASPQEVGAKLQVDALLTGSVRIAGDGGLRIAARLTESQNGFDIWSQTFEGPVNDPLPVQVAVASAVADALRVRMDPGSGQSFVRRSNDNPAAYDLYVQGRHLARKREVRSLHESIGAFEDAIRLDPGYAVAYAGLADAYGVLAFNGQIAPDAALAHARNAAARAVALDPQLPEALAHLAHLTAFVDWDWDAAEQSFRRAIELAPSHPRIRAWFGQTLVVQRRFDEALRQLQVAQRLDPLAPSVAYAFGEGYLYAGQYGDALRQAQRLLQLDAGSWGGHNLLARASMASGRPEAAIPALERFRGELWADALRLVATGDPRAARDLIDREKHAIASTQPFTLASLYMSAGASGPALDWLERAFEMRQVDLVSLAVEPALRPLHGWPRFERLRSRMGLSRPWPAPRWP